MKPYLCFIVFVLLILSSCAETEVSTLDPDIEDPLLSIDDTVKQLENSEISVPNNWEKTKDLVLRAAYARYLLRIGKLPTILILNDIYDETNDVVIHAEYYRAALLKMFGEIEQVYTICDISLKIIFSIGVTEAEQEAYIEAYQFVFPSVQIVNQDFNDLPLFRRQTYEEAEVILAQIRKDNPTVWTEHIRTQLVRKHGNTPKVHKIADFIEHIELEIEITLEMYESYTTILEELNPGAYTLNQKYAKLEAKDQLGLWLRESEQCDLKVFRNLKSEAIPFTLIDWTSVDVNHVLCR